MSTWTLDDFAQLIDHTNLHADATEADMARLCDEAIRYHFRMVAIKGAPAASRHDKYGALTGVQARDVLRGLR